jgi:hypothetical protein
MQIDRRAFLATLGSAAFIEAMPSEAKAEALEHYMIAQLDKPSVAPTPSPPAVRRGAGILFGGPTPSGRYPELAALAPMPERPTLLDFLRLRGTTGIGNHILQSANDALKKGEPEEIVLACLLHDYVLNLIKVDHGWWSAQLVEPYVSEKVSWAIRYHQALRFYPDPAVGYEYPELYVRLFGKEYVPPPYIKAAYEHARNHKWYMESRMITVHDLYAFEPGMKVSIEPFVDIVGRHFRQPKEGLGFDGSPVAHFWRTLIYPENLM